MMAMSVLAAALEFERDLLALEAQLDAQIAALERMHERDRRRPQDGRHPHSPARDYTRAPYIPPWATNRGDQGGAGGNRSDSGGGG